MINNIYSLNYYIILLLPLLLITGPFLSDLSLVIVVLTFLYLFILGKKKINLDYNKNLIILFLVYYFYSSILSLFSENLLISLKSSLFYFRFGLFVLAINYFLNFKKDLIDKFTKILIILLLFVCFDALFQFIIGFNLFGFELQSNDKLNGIFGEEPLLGSYLFRLLPLALACLIYKFGDQKFRYYNTMFIFLVFVVIFLSGSRASLYLSILFLILFFLFVRSYQKQILILGIIFFISFTIIAKFNEKFAYKSYYNLIDPIKRILTTKQGNFETEGGKDLNLANNKFTIFTSVHESHFITAYKIFNENKIFGVGNKMFRVLCSKEEYMVNEFSCSTHPHNYYLQILSENGIIGFLIISALFTICLYNLIKELYFRYFYKLKKINDPCIIILIGLFINLWPIVPTGNIFNNWLSILIYYPLGFYYFFKKNY
tara:strand:+ start:1267 stop:2556 length:1290 start_codon:yes stop_codon:yes gene_type:complete